MKKYKTLSFAVLVVGIISISLLLYNISHSYFIDKRITHTKEVITTGDLTSTLSITGLNLGGMEPMSDEDGMAQTNYATITLTKNNVYKVFYKILIGYDYENVADLETLLPLEYIHVALYPIEGGVPSSTPLAGPLEITELIVEEIDPTNVYSAKYFLAFDTFELETNNQTKSYAIKMWLKEEIPESYDGKIINLDITLKQETLISKSKFNLSGMVHGSSGNDNIVLTLLQNNNVTATSSSNGSFNLSGVYEGTYAIKTYDPTPSSGVPNTHYLTFTITPDLYPPIAGGCHKLTDNPAAPIGSYAPNLAYNYGLSPNTFDRTAFANDYNNPSTAVSNATYSFNISGEDKYTVTTINDLSLSYNGWEEVETPGSGCP
ncbi:MAG: hypothetical protein GX951_05105 [Mollicutes bacterium]|nr:hypothetical protein [Mollicutes bacterium]